MILLPSWWGRERASAPAGDESGGPRRDRRRRGRGPRRWKKKTTEGRVQQALGRERHQTAPLS
eukprot:scaffold31936_cov27-Tisochrysis_lutea.AAC.2